MPAPQSSGLRTVSWLLAAALVFQASASLAARFNPVETFTAYRTRTAATGR